MFESQPLVKRDASAWVGPLLAVLTLVLTLGLQMAWISLSAGLETWDDDAGLFALAACLEDRARGSTGPCVVGPPYPPLIPAIAAGHFLMTGVRSLNMALYSLWPWTVVLCGFLYVGVRRTAGTTAGLAAMALGPMVVWALHIRGKFYTEIPLAAIGLACVVALVASDGFRRRAWSVLLGVLLALGLLSKWSFAFFLGPPMAVACILGLVQPARQPAARVAIGMTGSMSLVFILAGAAGRFHTGLLLGAILAGTLAVGLLALVLLRTPWLAPDAGRRWMNLGLCVVGVTVLAGPWYLGHLGEIQSFLAANMEQRFHGDPVGPLTALPFYPAVLLTRVLSTPMVVLFVLGVACLVLPRRSPLAMWSLFALVSGMGILGVLPYRAGRYLLAGLAFVVPIVVLGVARWRWVARPVLPLLFAAGLIHQFSWVPLSFDGVRVPHHLALFTLPEKDLFGNSRESIEAAGQDLLHPRWRFLPFANPPIGQTPMTRRIVFAVAGDAAGQSTLTVAYDPAGVLNQNAMKTELSSVRAPLGSQVMTGNIRPSVSSLQHWQAQASHPPQTPETAHAAMGPRRLYLAAALRPSDPNHRLAVSELGRFLASSGWRVLLRDGFSDEFDAVEIVVWANRRGTGPTRNGPRGD